MAEANVFYHPTATLEKLMTKFQASNNFCDFMDVLEFAVENKMEGNKHLLDLWLDKKDKVKAEAPLELFSKLLSKFYIAASSDACNVQPDIDSGSESAQTAFDILEELSTQRDELEGRLKTWFFPVFDFGTLTSKIYPEDLDPCRVIGTYLDILFSPRENWADDFEEVARLVEGDCLWADDCGHAISFESPLHRVLEDAGIWSINASSIDQEAKDRLKTALGNLLNPDADVPLPEGTEIQHVFIALLLNAPVDFFNAWVTRWWLSIDADFCSSPDLTQSCLQSVLRFCAFGGFNKSLLFHEISDLEDSGEDLDQNQITLQKYLRETSGKKFLSYRMFWAICKKWLYESGPNLDYETSSLVEKIIENYTHDRLNYFNGISILDRFDASHIFQFYNSVSLFNYDDMDLTLLLSFGEYVSGPLILFDTGADDSPLTKKREYEFKQYVYLLLFRKAVAEGLPEFGNALLSFYLISLGAYTHGRMTSLATLEPILREALALPGSAILKHTLKIIVEMIEETNAKDPAALLVAKVFSQYLPSGPNLHVLDAPKPKPVDDSSVERSLRENLGGGRWDKLSEQSKEYLTSAELNWIRCAPDFGAGMKDWSGAISGYCKVLEKELVDRLAPIFENKAYGDYLQSIGEKPTFQPTLGSCTKVLKRFVKLPRSVQALIQRSGMTIFDNKRLLGDLVDITQNYRNVASHKDPLDMVRYAKFRKKYFEDGLIQDFIDSLG